MRSSAFSSGVPLAFRTIREHKLRAALTVLGVIIGTSTIIAVGSIIAGLDGAIADVLRSFGPNTIMVFKFQVGFRTSNLTQEERQRKPLTLENARALSERGRAIRLVSPYIFPGGGMHRARYKGNDLYQIQMGGTDPSYAGGGSAEMEYGRFFSEFENLHRRPVVVIGADVRSALFSDIDPTGKYIEVDGHQFEVIGVMQRPATALPGSQDTRVLMPYFSMRKMFPNAREHMLVVIARDGQLNEAIDEVRTILRQERRVPYNAPDNFGISTAEQMLEQFRSITATVALVMIVLSSIGLLVGGIGVMNIMLVSVTERTREIGIRKAIGARRADIIAQFLTEAVVLTALGGVAGILLGWGISLAAKLVFNSLPTLVPLWAVTLGIVVSVGVGLFFGIWPASKAARLDPVEALRYE